MHPATTGRDSRTPEKAAIGAKEHLPDEPPTPTEDRRDTHVTANEAGAEYDGQKEKEESPIPRAPPPRTTEMIGVDGGCVLRKKTVFLKSTSD